MCQNCGVNHETMQLEDVDSTMDFLSRLFGGAVDYFAKTGTAPELEESGEHKGEEWTIKIAVVGGGEVGKSYPEGTDWIIQLYIDGELAESQCGASKFASTHEEGMRFLVDNMVKN